MKASYFHNIYISTNCVVLFIECFGKCVRLTFVNDNEHTKKRFLSKKCGYFEKLVLIGFVLAFQQKIKYIHDMFVISVQANRLRSPYAQLTTHMINKKKNQSLNNIVDLVTYDQINHSKLYCPLLYCKLFQISNVFTLTSTMFFSLFF